MADTFENFLKRHSKEEAKPLPRDLFQAVVFYSRPVADEIDLQEEEIAQTLLKQTFFLKKNKMKFALENIQEIFSTLAKNKRFIYPFHSEDIFMSPKEAEDSIPRFIKKLIGQNKLPADVIKDNIVDDTMVEAAIVPLNFATLEKIDEFKNIKIDV